MRYKTRLYVDLSLLGENFQKLKDLCPHNEVLFMVKANAYGHGMVPIVRYAVTVLGIKEFGCATLGEARELRDELNDLQFEIYVFSDIHLEFQSCAEFYLNRRLIPVISNMADFDFILSREDFKNFPLCLKVDSGMHRLGFREHQIPEVISKLKKANRSRVFHLMSHLAQSTAVIDANSHSALQYKNFLSMKKMLLDANIVVERSSIANSGAIEQQFALAETHIRPGLIMYGPTSLNKECRNISKWTGRTISRLETYVIESFNVKKGDAVGYGGAVIPEDGVVALIALGYGDGFSCRNKHPWIKHKGEWGQVLGRFNMDMAQIYFPKKDKSFVAHGGPFVIWGHDPQDILHYADQTDSIPYEHFCQLTVRVPRLYCSE